MYTQKLYNLKEWGCYNKVSHYISSWGERGRSALGKPLQSGAKMLWQLARLNSLIPRMRFINTTCKVSLKNSYRTTFLLASKFKSRQDFSFQLTSLITQVELLKFYKLLISCLLEREKNESSRNTNNWILISIRLTVHLSSFSRNFNLLFKKLEAFALNYQYIIFLRSTHFFHHQTIYVNPLLLF